MSKLSPLLITAALALAPLLAMPAPATNVETDRLDRPASPTQMFDRTQLSAVANAGDRLVAVGVRGLVIVSDDQGRHWRQVGSPVASDLLALDFPTPESGWIVGHDGVVLHSADGGLTWRKQLDGRSTDKLLTAHFQALAQSGDADAARWLANVKLNYANGPEQALLDVWFEDAKRGFVVGSFGTLLRTEDGGATWTSWMERVDSKDLVHLNAVKGIAGEVYIASENGTVFELDKATQHFVPHATGYNGSFFALAGDAHGVVAVGLRGNAWRSLDQGATWDKLDTGLLANLNGAAMLGDGRVLIVSQDGRAIVGGIAGDLSRKGFTPLKIAAPTLFTSAAQADPSTAVLTGQGGVQRVSLK